MDVKYKADIAYTFALKAHYGKYRADNVTPYIEHIVEVVAQLLQFNVPTNDEIITVALLHDTLEKTETTFNQLKDMFGDQIAQNVLLLTFDPNKMTEEVYYKNNKDNIVKLADHLCNTRFFMHNKIKDAKEYYRKGLVIINNFRDKEPFKSTILEIEKQLNF